MNQKKFGAFIKAARKKQHLTQKDLADKYGVTYQAVSKWENGVNMPDTTLIKQMSEDFGVSLEELFDGEFKEQKNKKKTLVVGTLLLAILSVVIVIVILLGIGKQDFQFKTLASGCDNFNISGNIAYNHSKSAIYITNIKYCGGDDAEKYKAIDCILYEVNNDIERRISSYNYDGNKSIKLEDFLQNVTLAIDNYTQTCKEYQDDSLFLSINATRLDGKVITYKIPLSLESGCSTE